MRFIMGLATALFFTPLFAETMTMTWSESYRADGYIVKRGGCDGEVVHDSDSRSYTETIETDTTYCLLAYNSFGLSDPKVTTAWIDGLPPESVKTTTIVITVN